MWTPTPNEELEADLQTALSRPGASRVIPPRPVARAGGGTGWLWGRMRLEDGAWLGLATVFRGRFFEGAELGWHPAQELRTLD
jgi:hypothetical protein